MSVYSFNSNPPNSLKSYSDLLSLSPSRFAKFLKEKTVPKMSFASSSLDKAFLPAVAASPLVVKVSPD